MPNRILREAILTSERVNSLQEKAELFYRRLMSVVDDHGRYFANPTILRTKCYPLLVDKVREADINAYLETCRGLGLIVTYEVAERWYLQILNFGQQIRSVSKYPDPPEDVISRCLANAKQAHSTRVASAHLGVSGVVSVSGGVIASPGSDAEASAQNTSKAHRFTPPSLQEVTDYAKSLEFPLDAQRFIDHYAARGWTYNRGVKMKDWRAAVRTWSRNGVLDSGTQATASKSPSINSMAQADSVLSELERSIKTVRDDQKSWNWDGGIKLGLKPEALEKIKKMEARREEVRALKIGLI